VGEFLLRVPHFDTEAEAKMKSPVIKRSIVIAGHKTSVSIEDAFWTALKEIAQARWQSVAELIGVIPPPCGGG
jgi:predicted DNA-binding ribbon-helix-helix protein